MFLCVKTGSRVLYLARRAALRWKPLAVQMMSEAQNDYAREGREGGMKQAVWMFPVSLLARTGNELAHCCSCVCVCERERKRERESVCVCVCSARCLHAGMRGVCALTHAG